MAIGKIASGCEAALKEHFAKRGWTLLNAAWIRERLQQASDSGYANDIAFVVSKLILNKHSTQTPDI